MREFGTQACLVDAIEQIELQDDRDYIHHHDHHDHPHHHQDVSGEHNGRVGPDGSEALRRADQGGSADHCAV